MAENFHPPDAVLAAFAVGNLAERQIVMVAHHVGACDRCAAVVADAPPDAFVVRLLAVERTHRAGQAPAGCAPVCCAASEQWPSAVLRAVPWLAVALAVSAGLAGLLMFLST